MTFADQLGSAAHTNPTDGEVASKQEAKRLAFYLFWNVKPYFDRCAPAVPFPRDNPKGTACLPRARGHQTCRNYILQEDIEYFLPPKKAAKAFELLDKDQDGRVSLHDIRDAILQIYKVCFVVW